MSMCRVISCLVGKSCLLWPVHSLGKTLLVFSLLHFVLQNQTCLLFQVSLDFLLSYSRLLWWNGHLFFGVSFRRFLDFNGSARPSEEARTQLFPWFRQSSRIGVGSLIIFFFLFPFPTPLLSAFGKLLALPETLSIVLLHSFPHLSFFLCYFLHLQHFLLHPFTMLLYYSMCSGDGWVEL